MAAIIIPMVVSELVLHEAYQDQAEHVTMTLATNKESKGLISEIRMTLTLEDLPQYKLGKLVTVSIDS